MVRVSQFKYPLSSSNYLLLLGNPSWFCVAYKLSKGSFVLPKSSIKVWCQPHGQPLVICVWAYFAKVQEEGDDSLCCEDQTLQWRLAPTKGCETMVT